MEILVYIETKNGAAINSSLELLTAAKELGRATAVLTGENEAEAAQALLPYGDYVLLLETEDTSQDAVADILHQTVLELGADGVLFSATQEGKDLAPRLAARLHTGCVTDASAIELDGNRFCVTRPAYGGSILETMVFAEGKPFVASVRSGSFPKPEAGEPGRLTIKAAKPGSGSVKARLVERTKEILELVDLEGAEVIVAGGRGCGNKETFQLVEKLAGVLGGVTGASRPAIEEGWVSRAHQVGQSGKTVAPKLYIACGISGAMQHLSGALDSGYIVAINKDEDAPIFEAADLGIVGRCEEILPVMIEEIQKLRA